MMMKTQRSCFKTLIMKAFIIVIWCLSFNAVEAENARHKKRRRRRHRRTNRRTEEDPQRKAQVETVPFEPENNENGGNESPALAPGYYWYYYPTGPAYNTPAYYYPPSYNYPFAPANPSVPNYSPAYPSAPAYPSTPAFPSAPTENAGSDPDQSETVAPIAPTKRPNPPPTKRPNPAPTTPPVAPVAPMAAPFAPSSGWNNVPDSPIATNAEETITLPPVNEDNSPDSQPEQCTCDGFDGFKAVNECKEFVQCSSAAPNQVQPLQCGAGLLFNVEKSFCDYAQDVECKEYCVY